METCIVMITKCFRCGCKTQGQWICGQCLTREEKQSLNWQSDLKMPLSGEEPGMMCAEHPPARHWQLKMATLWMKNRHLTLEEVVADILRESKIY